MTHGRRIGGTAALFAVALICAAIASTTHSVIPVFVAWIPLLLVPWWLTRPVTGEADSEGPEVQSGGDEVSEEPNASEPDRGAETGGPP
jgi:hypothetical protein